MKTCTKCLTKKSEDQFDFRNKARGLRRACCKNCVAADHVRRYATKERKNAIRQNARQRKQKLVDKIWEYKSKHPCVDCGRTNPAGLEFDHLPEFEKVANISLMVQNMYSWEKILQEIAKCDVVCGYCHGIRTHERGGWVRNIEISV